MRHWPIPFFEAARRNWLLPLIGALFAWECIILMAIIKRIPYTEIDFSTYMEHARAVFQHGIREYNQIRGASGPIAYPAGYLYIFEGVRWLTEDGRNLLLAQILFAFLYLAQLATVFAIYWTSKAPPLAFLLATLSRRLHSIFVLRLFNDCVTMAVMHACILSLMRGQWLLGVLLYTVALSTKMNVLLFYPALALICLRETGWRRTVTLHALIPLGQAIAGVPFLLTDAQAYLSVAFNVNRRFEWAWTVNWRFLGEATFKVLQISRLLIVAQVAALLLWANFAWLRRDGGIVGFLRSRCQSQPAPVLRGRLSPAEIGRWLFQANLLGVILCKSLHYQFYSWYCWSLPFLLLVDGSTDWPGPATAGAAFIVFVGVEYCWNVFPSTSQSSALLLTLNILALIISEAGGGLLDKVLGRSCPYRSRYPSSLGDSKGQHPHDLTVYLRRMAEETPSHCLQ